MGCTLLTAFVHLCMLLSGILVHLVHPQRRDIYELAVLIRSHIYTLPSLCSQRRWDGSNL